MGKRYGSVYRRLFIYKSIYYIVGQTSFTHLNRIAQELKQFVGIDQYEIKYDTNISINDYLKEFIETSFYLR